jgi:hypothetical protein
MNTKRANQSDRRGVLLLLVLSCLTLFMMLGAIMLVLATRARTTARAFAAASSEASRDDARIRAALDEALMTLLRGPRTGVSGTIPESILGDCYGTAALSGTITALSFTNSGTLQATLSGFTAATPLALNGRVLTIKPQAGDPALAGSYRIINFTSGAATLSNLRGAQPFQQRPTLFPCAAIVNGRDFDGSAGNESWDKPDAANPYLTDAKPDGVGLQILRPAFGTVSGSCAVDNDADGIGDGIWLSDVLPAQPQENGSTLTFKVSYLVLDLDGRFNVNAHSGVTSGSLGPAAVESGTATFPQGGWMRAISGTGVQFPAATPASVTQRRPTPELGYPGEGRFGMLSGTTNPYTLRLDLNGPRSSVPSLTGERVGAGAIASLFTYGELERVVRPFDADSASLPPRLAAIFGDDAQKARMFVTTDSWDTTALTGTAASKITSGTSAAGLPQDVVEGRRFNLNAPMTSKETYCDWLYNVIVAAGVSNDKTRQWVANVADFRDKDTDASSIMISGTSVTGYDAEEYTGLGGNSGSELFSSIGQLLRVPRGSKQELSDPALPAPEKVKVRQSLVLDYPVILDAVTVPSLFAGAIAANPCREPGRVNVNTSIDEVWKAVIDEDKSNPFDPAKTAGEMLVNPTNHAFIFSDPTNLPYTAVRMNRADRLANIATTRSNIFAVWITVEVSESVPSPQPQRYGRLFAIVDRSIPVGFRPGWNLNARDTVRLIRYLD